MTTGSEVTPLEGLLLQNNFFRRYAGHKPRLFPSERTDPCPPGFRSVPSAYSFALPSAPSGIPLTASEFAASDNGSLVVASFARAVKAFCASHGCHLESTKFKARHICPLGPVGLCAGRRPQSVPCGRTEKASRLCSSRLRPFFAVLLNVELKVRFPVMERLTDCKSTVADFKSHLGRMARWWVPRFQPLGRFFRPAIRYAQGETFRFGWLFTISTYLFFLLCSHYLRNHSSTF